jgi:fatty-acyl-CoA synthase
MIASLPNKNRNLPFKTDGFRTVLEALDYAAAGETGFSFYTPRGALSGTLTFGQLRERSLDLAQRLVGAGLKKGDRVAMIAESTPDFFVFFYGCQYAGLVPVPLPFPMHLGGKEGYIAQLSRMMQSARAAAAVSSAELVDYLRQATAGLQTPMVGTHADFYRLPESKTPLPRITEDDICYIQYSSGSTRFPHGIAASHKSVTANCSGILNHGVKARHGDRCVSWLPLYHDMGLVGCCLSPTYAQMSTDFIATPDFARRPLIWLKVLSENKGTISFSPTFGYDICLRRAARARSDEFDLSAWRVAGIGAEMVRADILARFAETFEPSGFNSKAFLASYGLAESTLAVTFSEIDTGIEVDAIVKRDYSLTGRARPGQPANDALEVRPFAFCGKILPNHELAIRDNEGNDLADRLIGRVYVRGPSVMNGYFGDPAATKRVLSKTGWLDTGDMGYTVNGNLVITGRGKDLIIYNGRNIWPQDIEWAVEGLEGLRRGDAAAFSVEDQDGAEEVIVVVQCRATDKDTREQIEREIAAQTRLIAGADCKVVLAQPRSLPMTSSGKLSRTAAKANYLAGRYSPQSTGVALRTASSATISVMARD